MVSEKLAELREKEQQLRKELAKVRHEIEEEEIFLKAAQKDGDEGDSSPLLHHRPSYSLFKDTGSEPSTPVVQPIRELAQQDADWDAVLKSHPELKIEPIGKFDHWDRRECAIPEDNAKLWRNKCEEYMASLGGNAEIPKVIHQIWIGPREPPCLWIDTFRVEYLAEHPEWGFELWSDDRVAKLPMLNEKIYYEEKMWQCKADILRLEFLWHYGGLYVDADMISVEQKDLTQIVELGRQTGFVIAYEPDTKDKPYSILGNSVIACTPHHPLMLMLILYLKQTFYHKRNVIEVFAVTGPVMYTKCLVDSKMPISIAAQELLYPAFHFVPNPDAINFAQFPKCLMFQFGYTCSGLEGYVKRKNRCKKARICPYHSKKEWPLGPFAALPTPDQVELDFVKTGGRIPKVIHQLVFDGVDSPHDPVRWRETWWKNFRQTHPEFEYRTWTKDQLQNRSWFCANLYVEPMDDHAVTVLMLEVLYKEGGYYVPLSALYQGNSQQDPFFVAPDSDFLEKSEGLFAAAKGSPGCFKRIQQLYDAGHITHPSATSKAGSSSVKTMGFRDGSVAKATYKAETKFLGAGEMVAFCGSGSDTQLECFALGWAYECMVPCRLAKGRQAMLEVLTGESAINTKAIFVTDRDVCTMERLRGELPGLISQLDGGWDIMLFGIEWNTGSEEIALFKVPHGGRPRDSRVAGFVADLSSGRAEVLRVLQASVTAEGFDPSPIFDAAGRINLWFGAEKYARSLEEVKLWRAMPTVRRVFQECAGHVPPTEGERYEVYGNCMKGFRHDQPVYELLVEPSGGIMFRAWNDDRSTNCEMKCNPSTVEWLKVFYNHQVVVEKQNVAI